MFGRVKYMIMIYGGQEAWDTVGTGRTGRSVWSERDVNAVHAHMNAINEELRANGELVLAAGLADPTFTKTVSARGGEPVVTDGPYLEAKEFLAGWWVVDCADFDRVARIATRVSDAPSPDGPMGARVEIRPVDGTEQ